MSEEFAFGALLVAGVLLVGHLAYKDGQRDGKEGAEAEFIEGLADTCLPTEAPAWCGQMIGWYENLTSSEGAFP